MPDAWSSSLDPTLVAERVAWLLPAGPLAGTDLERRAQRLAAGYAAWTAATAPWAPGEPVTPALRAACEPYLPYAAVHKALSCLLGVACSLPLPAPPELLQRCRSWPDLLTALLPFPLGHDPSVVLTEALVDDAFRRRLCAALMLPRHHGNAFDRYPGQAADVADWLHLRRSSADGVRCLDLGSGSGEGSYQLAELLCQSGFAPHCCRIDSLSLQPLEVLAASHAWFPHDLLRQTSYRSRIAPLLAAGWGAALRFQAGDLRQPLPIAAYDLIVCNGVLGGPVLHAPAMLRQALAGLASALRPGGTCLVADRFHGGWPGAGSLYGVAVAVGFKPLTAREGGGGCV